MTLPVFVTLFLCLFALVVGVPRAMARGRRPEDGTFDGLIEELASLDTSLGK
jgi:hypothetical protein